VLCDDDPLLDTGSILAFKKCRPEIRFDHVVGYIRRMVSYMEVIAEVAILKFNCVNRVLEKINLSYRQAFLSKKKCQRFPSLGH